MIRNFCNHIARKENWAQTTQMSMECSWIDRQIIENCWRLLDIVTPFVQMPGQVVNWVWAEL